MDKFSAYHILGLDDGASLDDIKEAFRFLSRKYHPDSSGDSATSPRFSSILAAYRSLAQKAPSHGDSRIAGLDLFALGEIAVKGEDLPLRKRAIRKLGYSGRMTAAIFLRPCLNDEDEEVAAAAVRAAADLGASQLSSELDALWARASSTLRQAILDSAELTGDSVLAKALERGRKDGGPLGLRASRLAAMINKKAPPSGR